LIDIADLGEAFCNDLFHRFIDHPENRRAIENFDSSQPAAGQFFDRYGVGALLEGVWYIKGLTHRSTVLLGRNGGDPEDFHRDALGSITGSTRPRRPLT
jgi:hypothetical protein